MLSDLQQKSLKDMLHNCLNQSLGQSCDKRGNHDPKFMLCKRQDNHDNPGAVDPEIGRAHV